jgi:hypothetical protein
MFGVKIAFIVLAVLFIIRAVIADDVLGDRERPGGAQGDGHGYASTADDK